MKREMGEDREPPETVEGIFEDVVRSELGLAEGEAIPSERLREVTKAHLCRHVFDDRGLELVAALTGLKYLCLADTDVSDLRALAGLTRLEELYLQHSSCVTDVAPLAGLVNLRVLRLKRTRVSDLRPLAGLERLEMLDISDTEVADLTPLGGLRRLNELYMGSSRVTRLAPLAGCVGLEWLDIEGTQVADLTPLYGLARFEELRVGGSLVSEEQVEALKAKRGGLDTSTRPLRARLS